jgi:Ran GTPase-activating protein 1
MATSKKIFSLEGKGLKLDTAADLEPHIESLRSISDVEEVRLLGNTLGVEACKALGEVLETKKSLQVSFLRHAEYLLRMQYGYGALLI